MLGQFSLPAFYPKLRRNDEFFLPVSQNEHGGASSYIDSEITYPNIFEPGWVQKVVFSERFSLGFAVSYLMGFSVYKFYS